MAKCTNCTWKPGLLDEQTVCPVCNGSGEKPSAKKPSTPVSKKTEKGKK